MRTRTLWFGIALFVLLADQLSKWLIVDQFVLGAGVEVSGIFSIVRVHNSGAAFAFLAEAGGWQRWFFTALGLVAASAMAWLIQRHPAQRLFNFALACLLGGAIGNVIDRVRFGYVIDFLDFHWGLSHFPAFNLADSAITLGAICLILDEMLRVRRAGVDHA